MSSGIRIEGLGELVRNLAVAAARTRAAAEKAENDEATQIASDARAAVPVDSGELQGSITAQGGEVRASARHAGYVEHGTSRTPAKPYLAPAAEQARGRFPARITAAVKAALGDF